MSINYFAAPNRIGIAGRLRSHLRADATKHERGLGLHNLAIHLEQWVGEEINRPARRLGIDHQVAAFGQLETIGRIMTEVVNASVLASGIQTRASPFISGSLTL